MITQPGLYQCCNCKKLIDMIQTSQSIFLCCSKQFATCIQCARSPCPKCYKQRINRVNRNVLKAEIKQKQKSKLSNNGKKKQNFSEVKIQGNGDLQLLSSKRQNKLSANNNNLVKIKNNLLKQNDNDSDQYQPNNKNLILVNCMSCLLPIPSSQSQQQKPTNLQIVLCKKCEQLNKQIELYKPNIIQLQQRLRKRKQKKQMQKCISCQKLLPKSDLKSFNSDKDMKLCEKCFLVHEQTQRLYAFSKVKKTTQQKMKQTNQKLLMGIQKQKSQSLQKNEKQQYIHQIEKFNKKQQQINNPMRSKLLSNKNKKITQPSLITLTTIQKSRKQDQNDLNRKYSIEEAQMEMLDVEILPSIQNDNEGKNQQKSLKRCQNCNYYLQQKDGFWQVQDKISKNYQQILSTDIKENQRRRRQQQFLCMLCVGDLLKVKNFNKTKNKYQRQITIF